MIWFPPPLLSDVQFLLHYNQRKGFSSPLLLNFLSSCEWNVFVCTIIPQGYRSTLTSSLIMSARELFFDLFCFFLHLIGKGSIDCPVKQTGLGVVRRFAAILFHATGQYYFLEPPLKDTGQKMEVFLKKEISYLLFQCYNVHKAYPCVFCGCRHFHYNAFGLCLPFSPFFRFARL